MSEHLMRLQAENKELREKLRLKGPIEPPPGGPHDPGMEARVARLEEVLPRVETRLGTIEERFDAVEARLRSIEQGLASASSKLDFLADKVIAKLPSGWQMVGPIVVLLASLIALETAIPAGVQYLQRLGWLSPIGANTPSVSAPSAPRP